MLWQTCNKFKIRCRYIAQFVTLSTYTFSIFVLFCFLFATHRAHYYFRSCRRYQVYTFQSIEFLQFNSVVVSNKNRNEIVINSNEKQFNHVATTPHNIFCWHSVENVFQAFLFLVPIGMYEMWNVKMKSYRQVWFDCFSFSFNSLNVAQSWYSHSDVCFCVMSYLYGIFCWLSQRTTAYNIDLISVAYAMVCRHTHI